MTKELGREGEGLVAKYLINKGYEILERNFATKLGEIDIIARQVNEIVFVEVKTKRDGSFSDPWVNVNKTKMAKIWRVGQVFLKKNKLEDEPVRIDVVSVVFGGNREIEHFENVWED